MKILHLIHKPQNRGAETFTCQLAKHQLDQGHQVSIISIYSGDIRLDWGKEIKNIDGAENKFFDYKAWKNLALTIQDFHPDIVQANSGDTLKYAVFSKKIFGWNNPIIFRNASEVGRYLKSGLQKRLNSYLYKHISGVASVSKASEKDLICHFPFLKGKTKVIAVGLEEMKPNFLVLSPKEKQHIIHVGGFSFEKNHKELILIFKKVLKARPETYLHLIGDGKLKSKIENLVKKENIKENVFFYGFVDNPLDYINAGDVLVLPSIIEGLPGVLLEAMYCKTPVVAYNVGGIAEIVNSKTGSLVEKAKIDQFSNAIIDQLEQPDLRKVENASKMVKADFLNKNLAVEFLEFYQKVQNL
jgi:glycosyltransferase involved in cell wall biosynthesis